MKIATWNVERLKHKSELEKIKVECEKNGADILVLTETDQQLHPDFKYCYETPLLAAIQPDFYAPTENRVSIYTNYPCVRQHETYDAATSLCVELKTERGNLLVYGTIIGIYGNRHPTFKEDLIRQTDDVSRLSQLGDGFCFCGDFNCSFADKYYFTKFGRSVLLETCTQKGIRVLTESVPECIDHIAVTAAFVGNSTIHVEEWNLDKGLSDHKGIAVTL